MPPAYLEGWNLVGKDHLTLVPGELVVLAPGDTIVHQRLFPGSVSLAGLCTGTFLNRKCD